jgi:hypothetical protein
VDALYSHIFTHYKTEVNKSTTQDLTSYGTQTGNK